MSQCAAASICTGIFLLELRLKRLQKNKEEDSIKSGKLLYAGNDGNRREQ